MRISVLCVTLLLGGLAVSVPQARADEQKPDYAAAKKHYMAAKDAEKRGDWDTAVSEYAAAYDITKDPKILYSIGKAYEAQGNKQAAVVYYRRYINEAKDAKDRDEVKAHVAELEGKGTGGGGGGAVTPPPGGGGGEQPPGGGGGEKPPGGNELVTPDLGAGGGEKPPGGGEGGGADIEKPPGGGEGEGPSFVEGGSRWQRTAGWVSVGVAAVALTTGAVLGESAKSNEEDVQRLVDFRDMPSGLPKVYSGTIKSDYESAVSDGKRDEKLAIVAFSVAGVAAVAATVFFIMDPGPSEASPASSQAHGKHVAKKRRAILPLPMVGPDTVGVTAGFRF